MGKFWAYLEVEALERPESLAILAVGNLALLSSQKEGDKKKDEEKKEEEKKEEKEKMLP